jgi:hypothetical protein
MEIRRNLAIVHRNSCFLFIDLSKDVIFLIISKLFAHSNIQHISPTICLAVLPFPIAP